jgi:hypothetical protein
MQWQSSLPPHAAFVYSAQRQKPQPSPKDEGDRVWKENLEPNSGT